MTTILIVRYCLWQFVGHCCFTCLSSNELSCASPFGHILHHASTPPEVWVWVEEESGSGRGGKEESGGRRRRRGEDWRRNWRHPLLAKAIVHALGTTQKALQACTCSSASTSGRSWERTCSAHRPQGGTTARPMAPCTFSRRSRSPRRRQRCVPLKARYPLFFSVKPRKFTSFHHFSHFSY